MVVTSPLVSIIIPCYNYGHFLAEAVESVQRQTYTAKEIIIIDDGSTDNTKDVAACYPEVIYIYQENQGLSAARNTGIKMSQGAYLIFLDADDWLLPGALCVGVASLLHHSHAAFAVGGHIRVYMDGKAIEEKSLCISSDPYTSLLASGNYLGMISAVMFARWVLNNYAFDTSLKNCEDYDLYLNITRQHSIVQHNHVISAYRIHTTSMSATTAAMLNGALLVLDRQEKRLTTWQEIEAYHQGIRCLTMYYNQEPNFDVLIRQRPAFIMMIAYYLKNAPIAGLFYLCNRIKGAILIKARQLTPDFAKKWLRKNIYLG